MCFSVKFTPREFGYLKLVKYLALGSIGALTDALLYYQLIYLKIQPIIANSCSVVVGILVSYILNSKYTFKKIKFNLTTATRFLLVGMFGLLVSNFILWILINFKDASSLTAKVVSLPVVALIQFNLNRVWTFK